MPGFGKLLRDQGSRAASTFPPDAPSSGQAAGRQLPPDGLVRAIRFMVFMLTAQHEAVQFYLHASELIDDQPAASILRQIADEERLHARESFRLLQELLADENKVYQQRR